MTYMFYCCNNLTNLDVSHFDTSKVTNMSSMFVYCNELPSLDLSSFDTSKLISRTNMFIHCFSLKDKSIKVSQATYTVRVESCVM